MAMLNLNPAFLFFTIALAISSFSLTFLPSLASSRKHSSQLSTTILDVSASLLQAQQILTFNPQMLQHQESHHNTTFSFSPSSSSLFVPLHSRESLHASHHEDYKSLVLTRLKRDSARVNSLFTRLELALNQVNKSDLHPTETEIRPEQLSTPVSSGITQGSGEYFSRIGVGTPAKPFYMVLDTGSDVNWLQCQPCSDCYQQSDPIFDPTHSSSYAVLSCDSQQCQAIDVSACRNGKCLYQVSYGDGSFTVGEYITETVTLGNSGAVRGISMGCGHDNEGLFVGAAGLIGLGGGSLSFTSQIKASSFSYCLVDRDSGKSSSLEFNSASPGDSVNAALLRNSKLDTFYYVGITGISVGGRTVSLPPATFALDQSGRGGIIVDCGTAVTRLQTEAYNSLRDEFVRQTQNLRSTTGFALFDTCYDLSSLRSVTVPTVSFHFGGGKSWLLPAKNYLIPVDSAGTFCFAFAPSSQALSIIGNVQQQGTRVSFDLGSSLVGFSPNKC